jgi:hypothetical protein
MTIYTEHELRAMASKMRTQINNGEMPDHLRRTLINFTGLLDGAADGRVSAEVLQEAIDKVNCDLDCDADRRKQLEDVSLMVDQAIEENDPGAWRDAMLRWLPLLSEDHLRALMHGFADMIDEAEMQQAIALVEMPAATEVRQ